MSPGTQTGRFEERVEHELLQRGWDAATGGYDAELGIDTGALWEFVVKTQAKPWYRLLELYGGDQDTAMRQFAVHVGSEIDSRGVLDVLREGVEDRGVRIALAYFRPGLAFADDLLEKYNANVLGVVRQLRFSHRDPDQSVDLALFVNGLPTATIELKNAGAGQDAGHALAQYRQRDPDDLFFARRTLVHFAVDPDRAFITTRLKGMGTQFLPFNAGTSGPGKAGGSGNPPPVHSDDYSVSYLWTDIWQRDNWLEILQRFMHFDVGIASTGKADPHAVTGIFPRFHQWHAVRQMVAHAREHGAGNNYLIQHSAGSGTYNTIAWLAHGLSALFDNDEKPVFDKVVVIADRAVLSEQLQWTISQFDHMPGIVKGIHEGSTQLAEALEDATSKIVISTLQMYAFVVDKIGRAGLNGRRYAVILNDAHSSQTGAGAVRLRQALGATAVVDEDEDEASYFTRMRGPRPTLSYFAFTATPTARTLELFGTWDSEAVNPRSPGERGVYVPFHVYSMRQAIEEGFIFDVLTNYVTYEIKWRLRNESIEQRVSARSESANLEVDGSRPVQFDHLHPAAVELKAKLIIEDFRDRIARRLGGRAKAMVVCGGRQHALDMYQALMQADSTRPDCGFGVLIAFSGYLTDHHSGLQFTASQLNGFHESQLPDQFGYTKADDSAAAYGQEEYRILVVVDKYTTAFDQPLLCGMYVDKRLAGVAAVQTLSRLNRIHPLKTQDDVRILDFVNTAAEIHDAFRPWLETTITESPDPNLLYARKSEVLGYGLLAAPEMESFIRVLSAGPARSQPTDTALDAQLYPYLQPALDRFAAMGTDERVSFQDALQGFVRLYNLIAQNVDWSDPDLERLYQYGRVLLIRLSTIDIGQEDRAAKLAEEADEIRALAAAGDYLQANERLTRLTTEDPQQARPLWLELGFITLPDPDRQIVAAAWSAMSMGRAVQSLLAEDVSAADGSAETTSSATTQVIEAARLSPPQTTTASAPHRSPQQSGALLEQATIDLFARFFTVEPDTILGRLRRQGTGTQFGHDIETEWTVAGSPAVRCHVECKNLNRRVTVDDIAGKLAQQKYHHRGIQIDHWILISPHHDGANELPGMLEAWDQQGEYPFSVQIWSPETRVREMFALEPAVYEAVYGRPPTQEEISASGEVVDLIRQRLAPRLRVDAVWRHYLEQPGAFCFVNEDPRHFDRLYSRHLPLRAADDRDAPLAGTLMDQVTGWASNDAAAPMLLIADFGEGKSVFTYCLTRWLAEEFRAAPDGALFPLRIPLREFREAGTARGLLERRLAEVGASLADWRTLTKQVRTLVILDGFDEMSADLSPAAITANLRDIRSCLTEFSGSKILVTSRQRVLDGSRDWKRTLDRLGQPQIMRIASGPRRQRLRYLEQFATDAASARVLANLHNLYDPIGLAAKPLFLEMIKETLRDLPGDTFSEMILYNTYINKSLRTKWELLADPGDELTSHELIENLKEILEDVALRLQESNGAFLYLRDYHDDDRGKIAERLWEMRDQPVPREPFLLASQDDAANRVGIRSLLKAVPAPTPERWPVDFFHRSMREYFVARSIARSLAADAQRARQILSAAPLLPEIAHFVATILRSHQDDAALAVLEDLARSATTDHDGAYLGGNAFTLLRGAGGLLAEKDWSGLRLDHARLRSANLQGARFTGSSLRYANLDNANLQDADLTGADLEGVRLEETSQVLAVTALHGNRVIAAYEDRSLRKWHRQPGAGWESQVVVTLDHKADQLQVTPMGRVLASGEGMLSVLDMAGDADGPGESVEAAGSSETREDSIIPCAFRTSSRCRAAVLGARNALFTEEKDSGELLITWLDMTSTRVLDTLHVDETVMAWTQLDKGLFAFAVPDAVYVVSLLGDDGRQAITVADPAVTCLSVRADSDYVLLAAGHRDGSVSLTRIDPADTGVVAPQWTRRMHDGPVTDIFLDTEDQVITGSTDRRVCVTRVSAIRSNSPTSDGAESAVQRLHLTLRCKGVRFDGVRTEHEREKLRRYSEY
ncbi:pentapeptide repeat-containing protein [Amycolatopsis pigmentata]|uniref:Pentapeptide repeat-containing protein n=1 Tax=Amycolatopsis pigmentata TaxID=450801 RepID=A0ABW5FK81_9PSEU